MILTPGQTLGEDPGSSYVVEEEAWRTASQVFYRARKGFQNLILPAGTLQPASEGEQLRVLARVPVQDAEGNPLPFELANVLGLADSPWLPEPLDVVASTGSGSSILLLADPSGMILEARLARPDRSFSGFARVARQLLDMLEVFHRHGLVAGEWGDSDVVLDDDGRWTFLGTDRVHATESPDAFARDLEHWGAFCRRILSGCDPKGVVAREESDWLSSRIDRCLSANPSDIPLNTAELLQDPLARRAARWWRRWTSG